MKPRYSITSSARASSERGTLRPSALAALRATLNHLLRHREASRNHLQAMISPGCPTSAR
jgi:hypothetical protein